jgi:hypothetical protein
MAGMVATAVLTVVGVAVGVVVGDGAEVVVGATVAVAVTEGFGVGGVRHGPSWGYCGRPGIRFTIWRSYFGVSSRWMVSVRFPPGRLMQISMGV